MKRVAVALLSCLLLGLSGQSGSAQVFAGLIQEADADWVVLSGNKGILYFAVAFRFAEPQTPMATFAAVGKGRCDVHEDPGFTLISCFGSGRLREIPAEDFDLDPLLDSAHLILETRRYTHTVDWTGQGLGPAVGAGGGAQVDPDGFAGAGAAAGMARAARATGRLFDERLSGREFDFAYMVQEVAAEIYLPPYLTVGEDGFVTMHRSYRLPAAGR